MRSITQSTQKADLIQHPSAPVRFDDLPVTEESIANAKAAAAKEREEIDRLARLRDDDKLELTAIVDRQGWSTVSDWLLGIQAIYQDHRRG